MCDTFVKRIGFSLFTFLLGISAGSNSFAGGSEALKTDLQMSDLRRLAGKWDVESRFTPAGSNEVEVSHGEMVARLGPGEHSIIMDFETISGPLAGFTLHEMISWNDDAVSVAWVESFNPGITHKPGKLYKNKIVFQSAELKGEANITTYDTIESLSENSFVMKNKIAIDGTEPVTVLTLNYTRSN